MSLFFVFRIVDQLYTVTQNTQIWLQGSSPSWVMWRRTNMLWGEPAGNQRNIALSGLWLSYYDLTKQHIFTEGAMRNQSLLKIHHRHGSTMTSVSQQRLHNFYLNISVPNQTKYEWWALEELAGPFVKFWGMFLPASSLYAKLLPGSHSILRTTTI